VVIFDLRRSNLWLEDCKVCVQIAVVSRWNQRTLSWFSTAFLAWYFWNWPPLIGLIGLNNIILGSFWANSDSRELVKDWLLKAHSSWSSNNFISILRILFMILWGQLHHCLWSVVTRINSWASYLIFPKNFIGRFLILSFINFEFFLFDSCIDIDLIVVVGIFRNDIVISIWRLLLLIRQVIDLRIWSDQRLRDGNLVELVDKWWLSFHLSDILGFVYQLVRDLELILIFQSHFIGLVSTLVHINHILVLLKRVYFVNWPFEACKRILARLQDEVRVWVASAVVAVLVFDGVFRAMRAFIDIRVAVVPIDLTLVPFETKIYERACSWSEIWVWDLWILPPYWRNIGHS